MINKKFAIYGEVAGTELQLQSRRLREVNGVNGVELERSVPPSH